MFKSLERKDVHNKEKAVKYRQMILDKIGLEGREGKTLENLKKRKADSRQEEQEERLTQEAMIDARKEMRHAYLATVGKSGSTVLRNQYKLLGQLFPEEDGIMDEDKAAQYTDYKESLPLLKKQRIDATDTLMTQLCSLQYIPKDPTPCTNYPYGQVAYVNGKVKIKIRQKWGENILPYPLTVEWVKFCFHKDYVSLLMEKPKQWQCVVVGASNKSKDIKHLTGC